MEFKKLNMSESVKKMELWKSETDYYIENELDLEYSDLRGKLLKQFDTVKGGNKYAIDFTFGILLYKTLHEFGFTPRDAANDDKWRFLSLCVVPDLVAKRWGKNMEIRYFKQADRIWLKTLWWYIYLSMQKTAEETVRVLEKNTTDEILNLVDRVGKNGYHVNVCRKIMYYYWKARQVNPDVNSKHFRNIMILHTALSVNVVPELFENGADGYVKMLFNRIGVDLDAK